MKIITSDNVTLDDFERVQEVVKKIQNTEAMKKAIVGESGSWITYNGHDIQVSNEFELAAQIPDALDEMRTHSWAGKVYSGNTVIFERDFAQCLNLVLTWLVSIQSRADVTASKMRAVLEWLTSAVEAMDMSSDAGWKSVKSVIKKF
jgi:hypothetical protein